MKAAMNALKSKTVIAGIILCLVGIVLHVIPLGQHLFIVSAKMALLGKVLFVVGGSLCLTSLFSRKNRSA